MYPLAMSGCIATVAGGHLGLCMFSNTPILINVNSFLINQCDLDP